MQTSESPTRADLALVLLRVAVGGIFLAHGAQKLASRRTALRASGQPFAAR